MKGELFIIVHAAAEQSPAEDAIKISEWIEDWSRDSWRPFWFSWSRLSSHLPA